MRDPALVKKVSQRDLLIRDGFDPDDRMSKYKTREWTAREAIASARLEGRPVSKDLRKMICRWVRGEMEAEDIVRWANES